MPNAKVIADVGGVDAVDRISRAAIRRCAPTRRVPEGRRSVGGKASRRGTGGIRQRHRRRAGEGGRSPTTPMAFVMRRRAAHLVRLDVERAECRGAHAVARLGLAPRPRNALPKAGVDVPTPPDRRLRVDAEARRAFASKLTQRIRCPQPHPMPPKVLISRCALLLPQVRCPRQVYQYRVGGPRFGLPARYLAADKEKARPSWFVDFTIGLGGRVRSATKVTPRSWSKQTLRTARPE